MRRFIYITTLCLSSSALFLGCEKFFGDKTDVSFIDKPTYQQREIAYVPILPVLDNFTRPTDVISGFDELIYVVDAGTEEVISLDQSGRETGRFKVPGIVSVSQDRKLDLLATGTKKTNISGVNYDLSCIYRIDLHGNVGYGLKYAKIVNELVHPFYFKSTFSSGDKDVKFNKVAILNNNTYYVSRSGNSNSNTQFGGPDDAVLLFGVDDKLITPVSVTTLSGAFYGDYFKKPQGLAGLVQPPQITAKGKPDFIYTSLQQNNAIKVQYIEYNETEFGSSYSPKIFSVGDTSQADGFLTMPGKFEAPYAITISGDGTNFIFVTDMLKDSLFQFSNNGYEGVKPPPGSNATKYVKVSFGGKGKSPVQFNQPMGVAILNKIVYVADSGNGRILRFKLTTDFD